MTDPFETLRQPIDTQQPRPRFARELRAQLSAALGLDDPPPPVVSLPDRKARMSATSNETAAGAAVPYLSVDGAAAALTFYESAFGAVESFRVVGDDGRIGHAEFAIGPATFMISDAYPEMGAHAPTQLGGSGVLLYLPVHDADRVHEAAVAAGATSLQAPADQTHGTRTATIQDPFGHRWMLSQALEAFDVATYADRETDWDVQSAAPRAVGGIWPALNMNDAVAGIRFLVDVLGFEEQIVVPDGNDPAVIVHSQLRWPEGGTLQVGSANRGSPYTDRATGNDSLYVITARAAELYERCVAAGVEIIEPLHSTDYGATTDNVFSIRDPEGNILSFGSYAGE